MAPCARSQRIEKRFGAYITRMSQYDPAPPVAQKASLQEPGSIRARDIEVEEHDVVYVRAQAFLSIGDLSQGRDPVARLTPGWTWLWPGGPGRDR